jgi:hypothetical protein
MNQDVTAAGCLRRLTSVPRSQSLTQALDDDMCWHLRCLRPTERRQCQHARAARVQGVWCHGAVRVSSVEDMRMHSAEPAAQNLHVAHEPASCEEFGAGANSLTAVRARVEGVGALLAQHMATRQHTAARASRRRHTAPPPAPRAGPLLHAAQLLALQLRPDQRQRELHILHTVSCLLRCSEGPRARRSRVIVTFVALSYHETIHGTFCCPAAHPAQGLQFCSCALRKSVRAALAAGQLVVQLAVPGSQVNNVSLTLPRCFGERLALLIPLCPLHARLKLLSDIYYVGHAILPAKTKSNKCHSSCADDVSENRHGRFQVFSPERLAVFAHYGGLRQPALACSCLQGTCRLYDRAVHGIHPTRSFRYSKAVEACFAFMTSWKTGHAGSRACAHTCQVSEDLMQHHEPQHNQ